MVNYLRTLDNPQFDNKTILEVVRDFRKGGLNPENYDRLWAIINALPPINKRTQADYDKFHQLGLTDISEPDFFIIMGEVQKRMVANSKTCWHPLASTTTCKLDADGNLIVSAAHSLQNNGVLSKIAKNLEVVIPVFGLGGMVGKKLNKKVASIFWGFCNTHDAIFAPIETTPYIGSEHQNFLFAYRAFTVTAHKKIESSKIINFGAESDEDLRLTRAIFDHAIISADYSKIETHVIELPAFYPVAVSSCFYLDYDFDGNPIPHNNPRMEYIYTTLLPADGKTYFLLSYLKQDAHLYGQLATQLLSRNNLKSDISVLLAAHVENIYYNPDYYDAFIERQAQEFEKVMYQAQINFAEITDDDGLTNITSITAKNYLDNSYGISLFGY